MKLLATLTISILLLSSTAHAQNGCSGTPPTANVMNPQWVYTQIAEFTSQNPTGQAIVTDFTVELRRGTTMESTVQLQKAAFTLQTGTPANCYRFAVPAPASPSASDVYFVAIRSNGPGGSSPFNVTSNGFFVQGAPAAPVNSRLAVVDTISRLWGRALLMRPFGLSSRGAGRSLK